MEIRNLVQAKAIIPDSFLTYRVVFLIHGRILFSFHNHRGSSHLKVFLHNTDNFDVFTRIIRKAHVFSARQGGPVLNSSNLDMAT